MAQGDQPRASNGRFVKRRKAASRRSTVSPNGAAPEEVAAQDGTVQLLLLTIAIVLAVLGFAWSLLWVAALVVMGISWGVMVAERKQRRGTVKGLAAELVTTVVDEAKGVMDATSGSDATPPSGAGDVGDEERRAG